MSKRRREEDSEESTYEEEQELNIQIPTDTTTSTLSPEVQHIVHQIIRLILSRETKGQLIRREHISQLISNRRIGYDLIIKSVKETLEDIYGLTIIEAPIVKKRNEGGKGSKAKGKQPLVVINCLSNNAKNLLSEIWKKSLRSFVKNENLSKPKYYLPQYSKTKLPSSNYELVKNGILLVMFTSIILAENRISESSLLRNLRKFGISSNLNVKNSNLNMNIQELLSEFLKREYLNRDVTKGRVESENVVEYTLGRRALIEFPPQSCFEFMKEVLQDKFDTGMAERALVTIERAYGVALTNESETVTDISRADTPVQE